MSTTFLVIAGREAVCYSPSLDVAKTVASIRVNLPGLWDALKADMHPDRVPWLTTLRTQDGQPLDVPVIEWREEFGGYTAEPWLRIERLTLHDRPLPPMPLKSEGPAH